MSITFTVGCFEVRKNQSSHTKENIHSLKIRLLTSLIAFLLPPIHHMAQPPNPFDNTQGRFGMPMPTGGIGQPQIVLPFQ